MRNYGKKIFDKLCKVFSAIFLILTILISIIAIQSTTKFQDDYGKIFDSRIHQYDLNSKFADKLLIIFDNYGQSYIYVFLGIITVITVINIVRMNIIAKNNYFLIVKELKLLNNLSTKSHYNCEISILRGKILFINQELRESFSIGTNLIIGMGLVGSFLGLALSFYAASSSIQIFSSTENIIISSSQIVMHLIGYIFFYSYSIICSLIAYLIVIGLKVYFRCHLEDFVVLFENELENYNIVNFAKSLE